VAALLRAFLAQRARKRTLVIACPLPSKIEKYRNGRPSHGNSKNGWPKGWHTEQTHCCFADGDSDGSRADQRYTRLGGFSRRRTRPADGHLQRSEAVVREEWRWAQFGAGWALS
jgi:hypothetical protein